MDDNYINVIPFGNGSETVIIISSVSLTGLEGQGETVAEACRTFSESYTVYLFEWKKILKIGYRVEDMVEDIFRAMNLLHVDAAYIYGFSQGE